MLVKIRSICDSVSETFNFNTCNEIHFLNTSDILEGNIINDLIYKKSELKGQAKKSIRNHDILFSEIRPKNKRYAFVNLSHPENYVVSTKLMVLRLKENIKVSLQYFYYSITNDDFLDKLQRKAENRIGSFPQITFDILSDFYINIPSLEEQEKIANILSMIDDQVKRNNAIVKRLQVLALNSFDYFSKENNDSNYVILRDVIIERDKSLFQVNSISESTGDVPFFTSGETILYTNNKLTTGFNIFLSTGGNAKVQSYFGDVSYSTDTWCISAKNNLQYYLYGYLKHIESQMDKLYFHGTGLKHLQKPIFLKSVINILDDNLLQKYNEIVEPIYIQISKIGQETIKLQRLKNKLLPLLINQQLA